MKRSDVLCLADLAPAERAAQMLKLGAQLASRPRKPPARGAMPAPLRRETIEQQIAGPVLSQVHGVPGPPVSKVAGLAETGRTLSTDLGDVPDLVFTARQRRSAANVAMSSARDRSVRDLAIRQLGLGLLDSTPVTRCCAAYAYWQATQASTAVIPILTNAIRSADEEERNVAALCLAKIDMKRVRDLHGTAADDRPATPAQPTRRSMTVIIHGTFAMHSAWYRPGGDFHRYIKRNVFSDTYSAADFFFWSGRYSLNDRTLKRIWRQAARKLVSWCRAHPARMLRLIAHSHGNNVVNLATQMGLPACTLIQLSVPVRSWNLPDMTKVASGRLFNIHSRFDAVVLIDGGAQDYKGTVVEPNEKRRIIAVHGHAVSHVPSRWANKKLPAVVRTVCP